MISKADSPNLIIFLSITTLYFCLHIKCHHLFGHICFLKKIKKIKKIRLTRTTKLMFLFIRLNSCITKCKKKIHNVLIEFIWDNNFWVKKLVTLKFFTFWLSGVNLMYLSFDLVPQIFGCFIRSGYFHSVISHIEIVIRVIQSRKVHWITIMRRFTEKKANSQVKMGKKTEWMEVNSPIFGEVSQ